MSSSASTYRTNRDRPLKQAANTVSNYGSTVTGPNSSTSSAAAAAPLPTDSSGSASDAGALGISSSRNRNSNSNSTNSNSNLTNRSSNVLNSHSVEIKNFVNAPPEPPAVDREQLQLQDQEDNTIPSSRVNDTNIRNSGAGRASNG